MELISIGRSPQSKIVIHDSSEKVSRNHGTLKLHKVGSIIYVDHSSNGTMVSGVRIHNTEVPVVFGEKIVFPNNTDLDWSMVSSARDRFNSNPVAKVHSDPYGLGSNVGFLTSWIRPLLTVIDNGSFFRHSFYWIYFVMAILTLFFPIYLVYKAIEMHFYEMPGKALAFAILSWIIIAFVSWLSFQLFWDRKLKVVNSSDSGDSFVAMPLFSDFILTLGIYIGIWIGVVGSLISVLGMIVFSNLGDFNIPFNLLGGVKTSMWRIFSLPFIGLLIILVSRFISEQILVMGAIANRILKSQ
jgi:pSer/pThr/pTyr-binding forkhead associated (FHA) protein